MLAPFPLSMPSPALCTTISYGWLRGHQLITWFLDCVLVGMEFSPMPYALPYNISHLLSTKHAHDFKCCRWTGLLGIFSSYLSKLWLDRSKTNQHQDHSRKGFLQWGHVPRTSCLKQNRSVNSRDCTFNNLETKVPKQLKPMRQCSITAYSLCTQKGTQFQSAQKLSMSKKHCNKHMITCYSESTHWYDTFPVPESSTNRN